MAERTPIQRAAMVFGAVFLLVTVLGFIPGITTEYDRLTEFGGVGALLLGIFGVNILENVAHLLYGVAGLVAASSWNASRAYFLGGGALYLVLWIYGLLVGEDSSANVIGVNTAANWLHFVLGVAMLGLGIVLGRTGERRALAP
jgi:hypothetical protein